MIAEFDPIIKDKPVSIYHYADGNYFGMRMSTKEAQELAASLAAAIERAKGNG